MKNSETGEYELVVGNGQLLSAFFIVALLLGVAFGLGYMIGQNSQRSKPQTDAAAGPAPNVVTQTPVQPAAPPQAAAEQASQPADSPAPSEPPAPQPTTQPARETIGATAPAPPPAAADDGPAGHYWQVGAFKAAEEAQPTFHMLRDGGMPVIIKTLPDGLVRVLVGPYADKRALSNARQELTTRFKITTLYPRQLPAK